MGNFKAVPKQAQRMVCLLNSIRVTPIVVMLNTTSVTIKANEIVKRIRKSNPKAVSKKGYTHP